jgi:ATP-binding cassette subfamily B protein
MSQLNETDEDSGEDLVTPELEAEPAGESASVLAVLRFVGRYWRAVPWRITGMGVGVAVGVMLDVQIPDVSAQLVSAVEAHLIGEASQDRAWQLALTLVGIFASVSVVKQLFLRNWTHLASQVIQSMLDDGFRQVQRFSLDWHSNNFAGSTQRKITRGVWAYDALADTLVVDLGPTLALLVGFSITMSLRDPLLGLYFGTAVSVFVATSAWISIGYVAPTNRIANDADTAVGGALADAITCNTVVKSFGAEAREEARFTEASTRWRLRARRSWLRSMDAGAVQSILLLGLLSGLLSLVLMRSPGFRSQVENAVYVIATYLMVHGHLRNVGWQIRNAQRAINELDDLVTITKTTPQVADRAGSTEFTPGAGKIRFENVCFGYTNQPDRIFEGLSVEVRAGERLALVGESGSGKSTFVKLLQRLYDLDGGRIEIDGQDISAVSQNSLRRAISVVPQEPILFHRSLAENIGYGLPGASSEAVVRAAGQAHAHEFIERLEHGYETLVGERGIKLSGGERQRVAIARAILADAPILVLDEATSSLDSLTEKLIQDALTKLLEGRTAVIIAHRLSTIRRVDRILVFGAGRIIEEGTHDELVARIGGRYRRLVEMQTFGVE